MSKKVQVQCLICDDVAIGINFGVPTCMPCKAFFRRNADKLNTDKLRCRHDKNCSITFTYRGLCNACRLEKCFRVGMNRALILSDKDRIARNKLIETNRLKRGQLPKQNNLKWIEPPSLIRMPSNSFKSLSSSDQIILANIFYAYENTCITARNNQLPYFPSKLFTTACEILSEIGLIIPHVMKYFKHIPEFNNISIRDRIRLIQNQFGHLIQINESIMFPVTSKNLVISWTNVFEPDLAVALVKRRQITEQYNVDPILLRIILLIILFSSNNSRQMNVIDIDAICDDTLTIFNAQNKYVELLWRYVSSRSSNEYDLIKFINRLILFIIRIQNMNIQLDNLVMNSKTEFLQLAPLLQSMWPTSNNDENHLSIGITENINIIKNNEY